MATIGIHYVIAALEGSRRQGVSSTELLRAAAIAPELLERPRSRVHVDQVTRLVQEIWQRLDDELMGFAHPPCPRGSFAFLTRNTLQQPTLRGILQEACEFYRLLGGAVDMRLLEQQDQARLEIRLARPELDPGQYLREYWMVIWHRYPSWLLGESIPLQQVGFDYPAPDYLDELNYLFLCDEQFDQPCCYLTFPGAWLERAPARTQAELARFLDRSPADLLTIPGEDTRYSARIRALLLHQSDALLDFPGFEQLATRFHLTAQTLRRRLRAEGTSYQQLKEELRRDLAIEKLTRQPQLTMSEIARLLGFTEARSFTRAFRHWTGVSPSAYRRSSRCPASPPCNEPAPASYS